MTVLDEIRALLADEVSGRVGGRDLIKACAALARRLQKSSEASEVPHDVWHYLSDADIRVKDAAYRQMQLEQVGAALAPAGASQRLQQVSTPSPSPPREPNAASRWSAQHPVMFAIATMGLFFTVAAIFFLALRPR
jgi:hypothetical protein